MKKSRSMMSEILLLAFVSLVINLFFSFWVAPFLWILAGFVKGVAIAAIVIYVVWATKRIRD